MKLIFISEENLKDSFFIKDLVNNFMSPGPWWVVHEPFNQSVKDTKFVTRRISSLMSDALVINHAFSGDQKSLVVKKGDEIILNTAYLLERMKEVQVILLNSIAANNGASEIVPAIEVARQLVKEFSIPETLVFSKNSKSPLAVQKIRISGKDEFEKYIKLYEEESLALNNALKLSPSIIATPVNFAR